MKKYIQLIQNRLDKYFTLTLGFAALIAFIAAILLYIPDFPKVYSMLNFGAGIIFSVFFFFAHKIKTLLKIAVMIIVTLVIAIASFVGGSVSTAFLSLLIISNIIAVLFLQTRQGIFFSAFSVILMSILVYFSPVIDLSRLIEHPEVSWGLQFAGFVLLLVILNISSHSIKSFLIENIIDLEKTVVLTNQLAYYDQLTQLPNRSKFITDVNHLIETQKLDGFVVIMRLQGMQMFHAKMGREQGYHLLVQIADVLKRKETANFIIAKSDMDEFVIWADHIIEQDLIEKLSLIISELENEIAYLNKKVYLYVAYNHYIYGLDTLNNCHHNTELTTAHAKQNQILTPVPFSDMIAHEFDRKELLKDAIDDAIINEEFILYYQPKYDVRNNQVIGVEGLARWESKKIGFVNPSEFIPIIETLDKSIVFGNFVINQACKDFVKIQEKYGNDICVSINISPSHIMNTDIIGTMRAALEKYQIPPHMMSIEITEDIIIDGIEQVKPIIKSLRDLGVKISLDDFGSGYSSLSYLTQLELDEIKIDKSFIDQIGNNDRIHLLLENILHLAKQFDLEVISEGVETKVQNDVLIKLGYYYIQGYYFAKPEAL